MLRTLTTLLATTAIAGLAFAQAPATSPAP